MAMYGTKYEILIFLNKTLHYIVILLNRNTKILKNRLIY